MCSRAGSGRVRLSRPSDLLLSSSLLLVEEEVLGQSYIDKIVVEDGECDHCLWWTIGLLRVSHFLLLMHHRMLCGL